MNEQDDTSGRVPAWSPSSAASTTFAGLPINERPKKGEADLAILGIPWDGLTTGRPGARFGPRGIRQASMSCRSYSQHMGVDIYKQLRAVDVGDIDVATFDYLETFKRIESRVLELHKKDITVVSLGGDHSVLLPLLRAAHQIHPSFTLIHFDAHSDTSSTSGSPVCHHGTCVRNVLEEGLIEGRKIFQIGIRGSFGSASYLDYGQREGINVLDMHGFHNTKIRAAFIARLRETAGDGPCYLTFDIDGIDPAFAPGTGTPVPGGLTSFEAIDILRELRGLCIIGGDVVEVAPAYDGQSQITSLLAATITLQINALIAIGRQGKTATSII